MTVRAITLRLPASSTPALAALAAEVGGSALQELEKLAVEAVSVGEEVSPPQTPRRAELVVGARAALAHGAVITAARDELPLPWPAPRDGLRLHVRLSPVFGEALARTARSAGVTPSYLARVWVRVGLDARRPW